MLGSVMSILRGFAESRIIVLLSLTITPEHEIRAPPFTSSLVKSIVEKSEILEWVSREYRKPPPKPVRYTVVYTSSGEPLYKRGEEGPHITLRGGEEYRAWISIVAPKNLSPWPGGLQETIETPYGRISVVVSEISIINPKLILEEQPPRHVRLEIRTPLLLPQKLMTPPWARKAVSRIPQRYRLLPTPGLIVSSALRIVSGLSNQLEPVMANSLNYYLARAADLTTAEVDYRLKPTTVLYGKDCGGQPRKPRGVTGWVIYELMGKKIARVTWSLLRIASYTGLGKSRSVGFGEVLVREAS